MKPNVLIVYGYLDYPLRASVSDLLYAFNKKKKCNAFLYSIEQGPLPSYLKKVHFDLVVFTTLLLGERWGGQKKMYDKVYEPLKEIMNWNAIKVVHPQDEWIHTNELNNFINDFKISVVFTVSPESEWRTIYNKIDFSKVKFYKVLTGYLSDETVDKFKLILLKQQQKKIDIGYRAYKSPPWLGSHGYLKTKIAEVFNEEAPKYNFTTDISTNETDVIIGDAWLEFMCKCKYFIGTEGGSTVIDRDGLIFKAGTEYQKKNPNASFEDFEKYCFAGMDGNLKLIALSPRHLEACAAKTCQVLIEGEYNGVLIPNIHYIELKKDFSNIKSVFNTIKDEPLRLTIVERAYRDIVESKKYSYATYTNFVIEKSLENTSLKKKSMSDYLFLLRNKISHSKFWSNKKHRYLNASINA